MEQQSDAYYIGQVLSGNTGALKHLIEKYQHMAYTLAFRVVYNAEEAEEICQDAFLKAYRSLGTLRNPSHFSSWLYSIVYHLSNFGVLGSAGLHYTSIDQESTIRIAELTMKKNWFSDHIDTEQLARAHAEA
jgi:RNA polymerase sigma-70 factor (ECF subfamily)